LKNWIVLSVKNGSRINKSRITMSKQRSTRSALRNWKMTILD